MNKTISKAICTYLCQFALDGERLRAGLRESVLDVPRGRGLQLLPQEQQVVLPTRVLGRVLVQFLENAEIIKSLMNYR